MATERTRWSDERIDDTFDRIERRLGEILEEQRALRTEIREDQKALRDSFDSLRTVLLQIGFGLVGVLIAALVALVIAVA